VYGFLCAFAQTTLGAICIDLGITLEAAASQASGTVAGMVVYQGGTVQTAQPMMVYQQQPQQMGVIVQQQPVMAQVYQPQQQQQVAFAKCRRRIKSTHKDLIFGWFVRGRSVGEVGSNWHEPSFSFLFLVFEFPTIERTVGYPEVIKIFC
jgi:hypothetical protein